MTNKEKAKELAHFILYDKSFESMDRNTYDKCMEMAEWKDSKIKDILLSYTKWLDKRGFFREDLQCDFGHQIDTFLEMSKEE